MNIVRVGSHSLAYDARLDASRPPLVFVHGTPSSSREFEAVASALTADVPFLALDHLGFGSSDKPSNADYSLEAHSQRFNEALDTLGVTDLHLVVHDFGGPIALAALLPQWHRVRSLTLMNTWLWPLGQTEPSLESQRRIMTSGLMRFLYLRANFSARLLVPMAWGKHRPLTKAKRAQYRAAFPTSAERHGTVAFLDALFDPDEAAWTLAQPLARAIAAQATPVQIVWGAADKLITQGTLKKWKFLLPQATTHVLEAVGHFVCDEAPEKVAPLLQAIVESRPKTALID